MILIKLTADSEILELTVMVKIALSAIHHIRGRLSC